MLLLGIGAIFVSELEILPSHYHKVWALLDHLAGWLVVYLATRLSPMVFKVGNELPGMCQGSGMCVRKVCRGSKQ